MNRLTPELWAYSAFSGESDSTETRELDFNLARRSAVIINRIVGFVYISPDTTTGFEPGGRIAQEVDTDPDNLITEFLGGEFPDDVVLDSSRPFRQRLQVTWDTAAGPTYGGTNVLVKDWTNLPVEQRPISITALRHHVDVVATISNTYAAEVNIDYFIVELSLLEIGIINASRR